MQISYLFYIAYFLTGCITVISGRKQKITISSTQVAVDVTIYDKTNKVVYETWTPTDVKLNKSYTPQLVIPKYEFQQRKMHQFDWSNFFAPATYRIKFEKEDHIAQTKTIKSKFNYWTIANVFFAIIVAYKMFHGTPMHMIDPLKLLTLPFLALPPILSSFYRLEPTEIHVNLKKVQ